MNQFKHFVITRFNIKTNVWNKDKNGKNVLSDLWMKNRYELFTTYCFPSLKNQTSTNFKWLVFFDIDTKELYKEKNILLKNEFEIFEPIYVNDHTDYNNVLETIFSSTLTN